MTWLLSLLPNIWPYLLAASGAVALFLLGIVKGGAAAKNKAAVQNLEGFKKTTERMQNEDAAMGDDPAVLRERLRQRDPNQR